MKYFECSAIIDSCGAIKSNNHSNEMCEKNLPKEKKA